MLVPRYQIKPFLYTRFRQSVEAHQSSSWTNLRCGRTRQPLYRTWSCVHVVELEQSLVLLSYKQGGRAPNRQWCELRAMEAGLSLSALVSVSVAVYGRLQTVGRIIKLKYGN
jgi:hypothetical protein